MRGLILSARLVPCAAVAIEVVALVRSSAGDADRRVALEQESMRYASEALVEVLAAPKAPESPRFYLTVKGGMKQAGLTALQSSSPAGVHVTLQQDGQSASTSGVRGADGCVRLALDAPWVHSGELELTVRDLAGAWDVQSHATLKPAELQLSEAGFVGPGEHPDEVAVYVSPLGGALGLNAPSFVLVRADEPKLGAALPEARFAAEFPTGGSVQAVPLPCTHASGSGHRYALFSAIATRGDQAQVGEVLTEPLRVTVTLGDGRRGSYLGPLVQSTLPQLAPAALVSAGHAAELTLGPASIPNEKFGTNEAAVTSNAKKAHQREIAAAAPNLVPQQFPYELSVQDTSGRMPSGIEIWSAEGRVFATDVSEQAPIVALPELRPGRYWMHTQWPLLPGPSMHPLPFVVQEVNAEPMACDELVAFLRTMPSLAGATDPTALPFPLQSLFVRYLPSEPASQRAELWSPGTWKLLALGALVFGALGSILPVRIARKRGGSARALAAPVSFGIVVLGLGVTVLGCSLLSAGEGSNGDYNPLRGLDDVFMFIGTVLALVPTVIAIRLAITVRRKLANGP